MKLSQKKIGAILKQEHILLAVRHKGLDGRIGKVFCVKEEEVPLAQWRECDTLIDALREGLNIRQGIRRLQESGECVDAEAHEQKLCVCYFWSAIEEEAEHDKVVNG